MKANPAIALYLGESFATIGLFDESDKKNVTPVFEKSIFLPQITLKNLFLQTKNKISELFPNLEQPISIYIVTKYFDRLRQFRLGGSISQIILKDFENSYTLHNTKALSLAASQLIIQIDKETLTEDFLKSELERIKKINPDLNKAVIAIPENALTEKKRALIDNFLTSSNLKVFNCPNPYDQKSLRKVLLTAGSEGTKEELLSDLKETFGNETQIHIFCKDNFKTDFENTELFFSSSNFLAHYLKSHNHQIGAYFDIETLRFIKFEKNQSWKSPWGFITTEHYCYENLGLHPFTEVKLNDFSILQTENSSLQLEPGPVIAGRAIKPLLIDLFYNELKDNQNASSVFGQLSSDLVKSKLNNLFTALEKAQKNTLLHLSIEQLKNNFCDTLKHEVLFHGADAPTLLFGPLEKVFVKSTTQAQTRVSDFSWPIEIIKMRNLQP